MSVKILLNGAKGRMGQAILEAAQGSGETEVVAAIDQGDDPSDGLDLCDVVIDFSFHDVTLPLVREATRRGKAIVIGTTGHSPEEKEAIRMEAAKTPTVWAGNFSIGINLLFYLTSAASAVLTRDYNPEIVEMHHHFKKDAPSGTAERLIEILREARNLSEAQVVHGRHGIVGERPEDEIGVHSMRGGDVIGDHTVHFAGPGERLELTHRASSRFVFANGALRAANWVQNRAPGIYDMQDVLGLKG